MASIRGDYVGEFQKYFNEQISSVRNLNHKGNNQLYAVSTGGRDFLLKRYSTIQADGWNRGETEFRAISHLWNIGVREIPAPIRFYADENVAVYSFEEGKVLAPEEIKEEDISVAAEFVAKLHLLGLEDKKAFPKERTSCLRITDYVSLIEKRLENLIRDFDCENCNSSARELLSGKMIKKVKELKDYVNEKADKFDLNRELELEEQVITPGDFGFHNILVNKGRYIFLDFEYFGRDDPVKQILDFLHHDKTKNISRSLKNLFLRTYHTKKLVSISFDERMSLVDPLIGMNWALIYMNVVSKNYLLHLQFAHGTLDEVIGERLKKAEEKLKNLKYFD